MKGLKGDRGPPGGIGEKVGVVCVLHVKCDLHDWSQGKRGPPGVYGENGPKGQPVSQLAAVCVYMWVCVGGGGGV